MADGRMVGWDFLAQCGGWDFRAGSGEYAWWTGKEVQEKEGEEPVGITWVGSSILGEKCSLVRLVVQQKSSSRKMTLWSNLRRIWGGRVIENGKEANGRTVDEIGGETWQVFLKRKKKMAVWSLR